VLVSGIFSELNGLYPTAAGVRLYLSRAFGERMALTTTFAYMVTVVLVIAADAFIIGAAIRHVLHEPPALAYLWITGLLAAATGANLLGIKMAGWVQTVVTYTVLASTTALSLVAVFHHGAPWRMPLSVFGGGTFNGVQALAFGVFLYAAFEWVTTTAEEARTPAVITRALFLAPALVLVASSLFALALSHLVPFAQAHNSAYPQLLVAQAALGTVGEYWMLAATLLTAVNTFNGGFLVASRFVYAAARDGTLPRQFAGLNLRAVPWVAVVTLGTTSAVVAAVVFATHQWLLLVAVGAAIEAGIYALASACLLRLRSRERRTRPFRLAGGRALAVVGIVVFGLLGLVSALSDPKNAHKLSVLPASVILVLLAVSSSYVTFVLPRIRQRAAARASALAASRPRRRPAAATVPVSEDPQAGD
jgi:amino acid transporter